MSIFIHTASSWNPKHKINHMLYLQLQRGLGALKQGLNLSGSSVKTLHILLLDHNIILDTDGGIDYCYMQKSKERLNSNTMAQTPAHYRMRQKDAFTCMVLMPSSVWKDGDWANTASLLAVQLSTSAASWRTPSHRVRPRCRFSTWESIFSDICKNISCNECLAFILQNATQLNIETLEIIFLQW